VVDIVKEFRDLAVSDPSDDEIVAFFDAFFELRSGEVADFDGKIAGAEALRDLRLVSMFRQSGKSGLVNGFLGVVTLPIGASVFSE